MLIDALTYLPGDLLTKVDRASMAVSLEVRVPFLDPDLFAFPWGPSRHHPARHGPGQGVLRGVLRRSQHGRGSCRGRGERPVVAGNIPPPTAPPYEEEAEETPPIEPSRWLPATVARRAFALLLELLLRTPRSRAATWEVLLTLIRLYVPGLTVGALWQNQAEIYRLFESVYSLL